MSRRRYGRRGRDSLGSVVDDCAHIAAHFGPLGALATGMVGFAVFYSLLPLTLLSWTNANKEKLSGPAAAVFRNLLDQIMWQSFIGPSQWVGVSILMVCFSIAVWKALAERELTPNEISEASMAARALAKALR